MGHLDTSCHSTSLKVNRAAVLLVRHYVKAEDDEESVDLALSRHLRVSTVNKIFPHSVTGSLISDCSE